MTRQFLNVVNTRIKYHLFSNVIIPKMTIFVWCMLLLAHILLDYTLIDV